LPSGCLFQVLLTDDMVPVEDRPGFVPRDLHCDPLGDPSPNHVPNCCATEVVKDAGRAHPVFFLVHCPETDGFAGSFPSVPEVPNGSPIPLKHVRTAEMATVYTLLFMSGKRGVNWVTPFGGVHFDKSFGLEPELDGDPPG
jgi:hypothetical protein